MEVTVENNLEGCPPCLDAALTLDRGVTMRDGGVAGVRVLVDCEHSAVCGLRRDGRPRRIDFQKGHEMRGTTRPADRLRKLAGDIDPGWDDGSAMWMVLREGAEIEWQAAEGDERLFRDVLDEIADEIEQDMHELSPEIGKLMAEITGKPYGGCKSFTGWLDRWYLPRPLFEDGQPVQFGDEFVNTGGKAEEAEMIAYMGNGDVKLGGDSCGAWLESGEYAKRPERDSLGKIEDDATLPPDEYCRRWLPTFPTDDVAMCVENMIRDLLRRQRDVLERG